MVVIAQSVVAYDGSSFESVREAIFSDPYESLPRLTVGPVHFGASGDSEDNHLLQAARRTLSSREDLVDFPHRQKLFQANGICFTGRWTIDSPSPNSGYFSPGSSGLLVVRASVSQSETTRGHRRAFAIAGKLFPTLDPSEAVETGNFFAMENLIGTTDDYFIDAVLDNHPRRSGLPRTLQELNTGLRVLRDFKRADRELSPGGARVDYRPLYPIAELGLVADATAVSPQWMQLRIEPDTPHVDAHDFRDELRLEGYPGRVLKWQIHVAAKHPDGKSAATWQHIGSIRLDDYVLSRSCDARLHFAHPVVRK